MNLLSLGISLVVLGGIPSPEPLDSASHTKTFSIYFPFDSSVYDSDYLGNAESAASLAGFLDLVGPERIDSVLATAYASPEGVHEHNRKVSRRRAARFKELVPRLFPQMAGQYELKDAGEAWEPFRERIAKDLRLSDASRVRILQLLDDDSIRPDTKKWRLENRFGEDTWRYFKKEHFPYLRVVEVRIFYHDVPDKDEPEAPEAITDTKPENLLPDIDTGKEREKEHESLADLIGGTGSILPAILPGKPFRPIIGVSTNLLYDLTYVPNYGLTSIPSFSLEYYPAAGRYTFGADVEWPMWQHPEDHRYLQIQHIGLWARRYFKPFGDRYNGPYMSSTLHLARYGIGWDAKGWEGEGTGLSMGAGWKWTFGRFFIDAGATLGFFFSKYDPYVYGFDDSKWYYYDYDGAPNDFVKRRMALYWFGPTRVYLSIGFDLFNRKRR